MTDILHLIDFQTMHILVLTALWITLLLLYGQYRAFLRHQHAAHKLEEENAELSCFVYGAAHDLKAPLRAIDQIAARLQDRVQGMTPDQSDDMTLLRQRVRRASVLVDDLLEYWQAGKSWIKQPSHLVSANHVVEDCLSLLAPPSSFRINAAPQLTGIKVFQLPLQQVMINLLDNAIKHHDKAGGVISISVQEKPSEYVFCIEDDGPGIAPAYREKIFETFETLQSRDVVEGSGLGLSLVRRIVMRQGGRVFVEEAPGGGARFVFSWPKKQRA